MECLDDTSFTPAGDPKTKFFFIRFEYKNHPAVVFVLSQQRNQNFFNYFGRRANCFARGYCLHNQELSFKEKSTNPSRFYVIDVRPATMSLMAVTMSLVLGAKVNAESQTAFLPITSSRTTEARTSSGISITTSNRRFVPQSLS